MALGLEHLSGRRIVLLPVSRALFFRGNKFSVSPDAEKVAAYLESRVRKRGINGVVYYNQLASLLGFPPVTDAWLSHPFAGIFDELDNDDHAKKKPFRSALVIAERTTQPGEGFWAMVLRLRFPKKTRFSEKERIKFYADELQALVQCYPALSV